MPTAAPGRCTQPGCSTLTTTGRCDDHPRKAWASKPPSWSAGSTRRWRLLRSTVLDEEPFCRVCGGPSEEVDHIRPISLGGSRYLRANLQALCSDCHSDKTHRESLAARRRGRASRG